MHGLLGASFQDERKSVRGQRRPGRGEGEEQCRFASATSLGIQYGQGIIDMDKSHTCFRRMKYTYR